MRPVGKRRKKLSSEKEKRLRKHRNRRGMG